MLCSAAFVLTYSYGYVSCTRYSGIVWYIGLVDDASLIQLSFLLAKFHYTSGRGVFSRF